MKKMDVVIIAGLMFCSFLIGMLARDKIEIQDEELDIPYCDFYLTSNGNYFNHTPGGLQEAIYDLNNSNGGTIHSVSIPCEAR